MVRQIFDGNVNLSRYLTVSAYLYRAYGFYILPGKYRNIFYALRECSTWYSYPEVSGKAMFEFYDYTKRTDRLWDVCKYDGYH